MDLFIECLLPAIDACHRHWFHFGPNLQDIGAISKKCELFAVQFGTHNLSQKTSWANCSMGSSRPEKAIFSCGLGLHCLKKTGLLWLIWHNFTNSQRSLIIFGTGRPYSILNSQVKKFLNWLRTSCVVAIATVATWWPVTQKTGPYDIWT